MLLFADDAVLFSKSHQSLQLMLNKIDEYRSFGNSTSILKRLRSHYLRKAEQLIYGFTMIIKSWRLSIFLSTSEKRFTKTGIGFELKNVSPNMEYTLYIISIRHCRILNCQ